MDDKERLERRRAANRRWYEKNRERVLEKHRQWRQDNPDRMKELNAKWYAEHRPVARAARAAWTKSHPEYHKTWRLLKIGCPPEQYKALMEKQGARCAICGKEAKVLHTDHCHTTGAIRGLLCFRCNAGIGSFEDNTDLLRAAIRYLDGS